VLNVALTGNIAAGKSTVVSWLRRWGATIIDADELAREAEAPGTEVLAAIVKRFGANVRLPDGALDRAALRSKVMGDDAALADLNAIVHPAVRRARLRALRGLSNEEADRMIAAQMDAERKRARSQYVIDNDGSLKKLEAKARAVFKELMQRARSTKPLP